MGTTALILLFLEGFPHQAPPCLEGTPQPLLPTHQYQPCPWPHTAGRASPQGSPLSELRESTVAAPQGLSTPLPAPQGAQHSWKLNNPTASFASLTNIYQGPALCQMLG